PPEPFHWCGDRSASAGEEAPCEGAHSGGAGNRGYWWQVGGCAERPSQDRPVVEPRRSDIERGSWCASPGTVGREGAPSAVDTQQPVRGAPRSLRSGSGYLGDEHTPHAVSGVVDDWDRLASFVPDS